MAYSTRKSLYGWLRDSAKLTSDDMHNTLDDLGVITLEDLARLHEDDLPSPTNGQEIYQFYKAFDKLQTSYGRYTQRKQRDRMRKEVNRIQTRIRRNVDPQFAQEVKERERLQKKKYRAKKKGILQEVENEEEDEEPADVTSSSDRIILAGPDADDSGSPGDRSRPDSAGDPPSRPVQDPDDEQPQPVYRYRRNALQESVISSAPVQESDDDEGGPCNSSTDVLKQVAESHDTHIQIVPSPSTGAHPGIDNSDEHGFVDDGEVPGPSGISQNHANSGNGDRGMPSHSGMSQNALIPSNVDNDLHEYSGVTAPDAEVMHNQCSSVVEDWSTFFDQLDAALLEFDHSLPGDVSMIEPAISSCSQVDTSATSHDIYAAQVLAQREYEPACIASRHDEEDKGSRDEDALGESKKDTGNPEMNTADNTHEQPEHPHTIDIVEKDGDEENERAHEDDPTTTNVQCVGEVSVDVSEPVVKDGKQDVPPASNKLHHSIHRILGIQAITSKRLERNETEPKGGQDQINVISDEFRCQSSISQKRPLPDNENGHNDGEACEPSNKKPRFISIMKYLGSKYVNPEEHQAQIVVEDMNHRENETSHCKTHYESVPSVSGCESHVSPVQPVDLSINGASVSAEHDDVEIHDESTQDDSGAEQMAMWNKRLRGNWFSTCQSTRKKIPE